MSRLFAPNSQPGSEVESGIGVKRLNPYSDWPVSGVRVCPPTPSQESMSGMITGSGRQPSEEIPETQPSRNLSREMSGSGSPVHHDYGEVVEDHPWQSEEDEDPVIPPAPEQPQRIQEESKEGFRWRGRYLLLTFPHTGDPGEVRDASVDVKLNEDLVGKQVETRSYKGNKVLPRLTREMVRDFLLGLGIPITGYSIAEEAHTLGGLHIHCVLEFGPKRWDCKNVRFFDIPVAGGSYHPNWRTLGVKRAMNNALIYIRKEDKDPIGNLKPKGTYIELAKEGKVAEAIEDFAKSEPARFALHKESIEANFWALAEENNKTIQEVKWKLDDFKLTESQRNHIIQWITLNAEAAKKGQRERCLILCGASGTGKSKLAQAIAHHAKRRWWLGTGSHSAFEPFKRKHVDPAKLPDCIIFDDISFNKKSRQNALKTVDQSEKSAVRILYGEAIIPKGVWRIMTCNDLNGLFSSEEFGGEWWKDPAMRSRCALIRCNEKMFEEENHPDVWAEFDDGFDDVDAPVFNEVTF